MENNQTNNNNVADELDDIVEFRTSNSKHYHNSNGSYSAVIFDSPVHYFDEEDKTYKEIDMSLEEDNTRLFDGYKVKSNKFGVKFAKVLGAPSLMVLEDRIGKIDISCGGGVNRAMRLLANKGAVAKINYVDKKVSVRKKLMSQSKDTTFSAVKTVQTIPVVEKVKSIVQQRLEQIKKAASNIMYENAFVGADLEYVLSSNKIKENIIVGSNAEFYEYNFTIKLDGFDMQIATDGSGINIVSKKDGAVKYIIPAPFMYDANEVRSDAVMLKLDKISDGVFELDIVADKAWIDAPERVLPVVIDPQIISTETADIIMNSYINGVLDPSNDNLNALGRCYGKLYDMKVEIKTPNIVSKVFSNDTRVLNATIELTKAQDWRKEDSQGFNVLKDGRIIDHFTYNGFNNRVDINITNELNAAIKGNVTNSVFDIQAIDRDSTDNDYMILINSSDWNSEYRPKIMIDYVSDRLSLGSSYHTSDVKRAGIGEVNLFNGNLTFTHTDLVADGNNLPFDLKHIYMSKLKGKEYDCEIYGNEERQLTPNFKMGKGWKMNIQQYLLKDEEDKTKATYLDGNGEVQLFEEKYFYEENGVRKFVKKEQCTKNADGSLTTIVSANGQQSEKTVTKALLTESGLMLLTDPNKNGIIATTENKPIKTTYYATYKGSKVPVEVEKSIKCKFVRYCYSLSYYTEDQVDKIDDKYYLKSNPDIEVAREEKEYYIEYDNNKEPYISVIEKGYYHYKYVYSFQYTSVKVPITVEYEYENGEKETHTQLFANENILSLYNEIEEINGYKRELQSSYDSYCDEAYDLSNPSELEKKMKSVESEYKSISDRISQLNIENNIDSNTARETLLNMNRTLSYCSSDYKEVSKIRADKEKELNYNKLYSKKQKDVQDDLSSLTKLVEGYEEQYEELQKKIEDYNREIEKKNIDTQRRLVALNQQMSTKEKEYNKLQEALNQETTNDRLALIAKEKNDILIQISKYDEIIKDKEVEIQKLIDEEKLKSIDYIIDDSGNKLGFDFYGRLVEITDNNNNKTFVVYDGENIDKITTKDGKTIQFDYYLGRLNKMFDTRQRMTLFEYNDNGFLSKIVYPDNQAISFDGNYDNRITEFKYNPYDELEEVRDQSGYAVKYTYNYFKQVETVKEYTYTEEISSDSFVQSETPIDGDSVTILYNNFKSTSVKNNRGVATTYVFDNAGRAVNIYRDDQFISQDRLNVTEAVNLSFNGRRKAYDVAVSQTAKNYVQNYGFENGTTSWIDLTDVATTNCSVIGTGFVGGSNALKIEGHPQQTRYAKQVILASALPKGRNLIFAAWAKAQSAFIRSDRSSGYGDDIFENYNIDSFDDYKRNRKFGIRAIIKYEGFEPETMETTFDWYNTAWQFTSLPIRLLKDRTLESITLYLDYSNNINSVLFDNVQLIEGEGEYKEYYEDGKLRYSTDGKIDCFYPDYYNGLPSHVIRVDEFGNRFATEYAYDEQKRLVRSVNYNGIVTENTYRDNGDILKTEMYHKDDPGTKFVSESLFDEKGNKIGEVDPRGEVDGKVLSTDFSYIDGTNLLKECINGRGIKTSYAYDYANDNLLSISKTCNGEDNSNLFVYKKGLLTKVYNDSANYEFGYDGFGRDKVVKINGDDYINYSYQDNADGSYVITTKFAGGEVLTEHFNKIGDCFKKEYAPTQAAPIEQNVAANRIVAFNMNGARSFSFNSVAPQTLVENTYNEDGVLVSYTDGLIGETHNFEYDNYNRVTSESYARNGVQIVSGASYDGKDNVISNTLKIGAETIQYTYEYDHSFEPKLQNIVLPDGNKSRIDYDKLGRNYENVLMDAADNVLLRSYTYYLKYGDHTTNFLSSVRYGVKGALTEHTKFTYDGNGNILTVVDNGNLSVRYAYDELDRLVREDNALLGKTYLYSYDNNGNILTKKECAYTLGDNPQGDVHAYVYSVGKWKDLLMGFDGEACEYDAFGNATTYRGHNLTYSHCGNLRTFDNIAFDYDASGKRVRKTVGGLVTDYIYDGGNLVRQANSERVIDFFYDKSGLVTFKLNGVSYYVRKNPSGDITHIFDMSGNLKARYVYDAWGNHKVFKADGTEDVDAMSVGNINPMRYRGYYYDTETELYYLNSRYYDSEVGRFINADSITNLKESMEDIGGLNLFAYCLNNPVNAIDNDGDLSWWKKLLIGLAVIVAVAIVAVATAGTGVGVVAGAALTGAIKGAAIGALTGAALGAVSGGIQGYIQNGWKGVLSGMANGALNGMADGFMGGAITGAITGAASGIKTLSSTSKLGAGKSSCTSSNCFVAGTKILTEHGKKNIEEIKVGDKVWSWNENTNKHELKTVVQLFRNNKRDMVYITVNGEKITTTTEHPFYVKGKGWVRAKDLLDTDRLVCYNGDELKIESVLIEYAESSVRTYNFEVEGNHNYYVSDVTVLVHNVCVAREGSYRADVKIGGDPNHAVGHAHIYEGSKNIASVDSTGKVLAGKLKGSAKIFVKNHIDEIATGINKYYYLR